MYGMPFWKGPHHSFIVGNMDFDPGTSVVKGSLGTRVAYILSPTLPPPHPRSISLFKNGIPGQYPGRIYLIQSKMSYASFARVISPRE